MHNKNLKQIFFWPLVIALISAYGLVAALIVDGGNWEYLAVIALAVPVIVMVYFYWIKK